MPRPTHPITISAHPFSGRVHSSKEDGRVRVAWMKRGSKTWRVEFEEGHEYAAALAVMDHAQRGGPLAIDEFEAVLLAAQILDTAQEKFQSISEHIAAVLAAEPARTRQAA
ncbi:MAG TPA: hypothetical protein VK176_09110 [Phycisphaerales bacterium]|nr:hypothetical protein [Phycisphaerales bacterium]